MSFIDCIQKSSLTNGQKDQLLSEYNELYERYRSTMGDDQAAAAAAGKYVGIKERQLNKVRENRARDIIVWEGLKKRIDDAAAVVATEKDKAGVGRILWGKSNTATAVRSFLESIYTRHATLEGRAQRAIAGAIEKYRSKNAGISQDVEGFKNVWRAILGEKSSDAGANADGAAIRQVFDILHRDYETAGGVLGKLENYAPQSHNTPRIREAGFESWRDFIIPLLDRERMIDLNTGLPFTDRRLVAALAEVYDGISTNGLNHITQMAEEGKQIMGRGGSIAKRHSSARFLHFKDADSFFAYNERFGFGDAGLFDAMMHHIHSMTRDIAIMQEMGPNPAGQIERLKMKIRADNAPPQTVRTVEGMYDVLAGRTGYRGDTGPIYNAVRALQDWLRSAYLVGAPISALSDSFYAGYTAKLNGLDATKTMGRWASSLNPLDGSDRRIARRIAFVSGASSGKSLQGARFQDEMGSRGLTGWLASFTNRASGLQVMTDGVKSALPLETMGFMSEVRASKIKWEDLDPAMREAFERWDMSEADFENIKSSNPYIDVETEADFIRPEDVALAGFLETATKYDMWLNDMALTASNEPRLLTRAMATGSVLGDAREGTALRAVSSSVMMFKSFPVTVIMNHLLPAMRHAATERGLSRASRLAPLLVGTAFMGMISLQARQIIQGKTIRDFDEKLVASSILQGGGLGIFGDFIFSDYSRFGQSLTTTMQGPVFGFANDAMRVFAGNFDRLLDEEDESKFWPDFYKFAERNIPAAKLWYIRLFTERLMLDQINRMVDPAYDDRLRRIENRMKEDYGQEFWWKPGQALPK